MKKFVYSVIVMMSFWQLAWAAATGRQYRSGVAQGRLAEQIQDFSPFGSSQVPLSRIPTGSALSRVPAQGAPVFVPGQLSSTRIAQAACHSAVWQVPAFAAAAGSADSSACSRASIWPMPGAGNTVSVSPVSEAVAVVPNKVRRPLRIQDSKTGAVIQLTPPQQPDNCLPVRPAECELLTACQAEVERLLNCSVPDSLHAADSESLDDSEDDGVYSLDVHNSLCEAEESVDRETLRFSSEAEYEGYLLYKQSQKRRRVEGPMNPFNATLDQSLVNPDFSLPIANNVVIPSVSLRQIRQMGYVYRGYRHNKNMPMSDLERQIHRAASLQADEQLRLEQEQSRQLWLKQVEEKERIAREKVQREQEEQLRLEQQRLEKERLEKIEQATQRKAAQANRTRQQQQAALQKKQAALEKEAEAISETLFEKVQLHSTQNVDTVSERVRKKMEGVIQELRELQEVSLTQENLEKLKKLDQRFTDLVRLSNQENKKIRNRVRAAGSAQILSDDALIEQAMKQNILEQEAFERKRQKNAEEVKERLQKEWSLDLLTSEKIAEFQTKLDHRCKMIEVTGFREKQLFAVTAQVEKTIDCAEELTRHLEIIFAQLNSSGRAEDDDVGLLENSWNVFIEKVAACYSNELVTPVIKIKHIMLCYSEREYHVFKNVLDQFNLIALELLIDDISSNNNSLTELLHNIFVCLEIDKQAERIMQDGIIFAPGKRITIR